MRLSSCFFLISILSGTALADVRVNSGNSNQPARSAITIPHLTKVPQRVVALNWTAVEMLLSLDVVPVGAASIKGYRQWQSDHPQLPEGVTELGSRSQVNFRAVAALKPDLIVGYPWRHRSLYPALTKIAPTLLLPQYPQPGDHDFHYFEAMRVNFMTLAKVLHRKDRARALLADMQRSLDKAKQQLHSAGMQGQKVAVAKAIGMGLGVRVFSPESLAGTIAIKIGLQNHWQSHIPGRDFSHIQLRELAEFKDTHVFMVGGLDENAQQLTDSSLWPYLPFVAEHKLSTTPQLWSFGGPVSAIRMAETLTRTLLEVEAQSGTNKQIPNTTLMSIAP